MSMENDMTKADAKNEEALVNFLLKTFKLRMWLQEAMNDLQLGNPEVLLGSMNNVEIEMKKLKEEGFFE